MATGMSHLRLLKTLIGNLFTYKKYILEQKRAFIEQYLKRGNN